MTTQTIDQLLQERDDLRRRLEEAEDIVRALRAGEVDAIVVEAEPRQVYTLDAADRPSRHRPHRRSLHGISKAEAVSGAWRRAAVGR